MLYYANVAVVFYYAQLVHLLLKLFLVAQVRLVIVRVLVDAHDSDWKRALLLLRMAEGGEGGVGRQKDTAKLYIQTPDRPPQRLLLVSI